MKEENKKIVSNRIILRTILVASIFFLFFSLKTVLAKECFPEKPAPARFVNDLANVFTTAQKNELENKIGAFSDTNSTQILVITVSDLCGYDKSSFAQQIGEKWGVGNKDFNNGVVILVKPKEIDGKGEAFIASGYGLEGALPDAICWDIVQNEMIPLFKKKAYFEGVDAAVNIIIGIASGEFKTYEPNRTPQISGLIVFFLIIAIYVALAIYRSRKYGPISSAGRRGGTIFYGGGGFSGGRSSSWGGSSRSFGGGSFGGGGAGGSW